jgi:hypothetical protein
MTTSSWPINIVERSCAFSLWLLAAYLNASQNKETDAVWKFCIYSRQLSQEIVGSTARGMTVVKGHKSVRHYSTPQIQNGGTAKEAHDAAESQISEARPWVTLEVDCSLLTVDRMHLREPTTNGESATVPNARKHFLRVRSQIMSLSLSELILCIQYRLSIFLYFTCSSNHTLLLASIVN